MPQCVCCASIQRHQQQPQQPQQRSSPRILASIDYTKDGRNVTRVAAGESVPWRLEAVRPPLW